MNTDNTLAAIDRTLTFHSAGLGADVTVTVERNDFPMRTAERAAAHAVANVQNAITSALEALRPFFADWLEGAKRFLDAAGPLVAAVERRREWQRVLGRYNHPDLYATMWDRKTARTSRAWIVRSVGR